MVTDSTHMDVHGAPEARASSIDRRGRFRAWLRRRRRDDRGVTLVEAAFITPVFMLMIFGIVEFSGYVMSRTSANAAVKAGTRASVVWGNKSMADREILKRMSQEGAGLVAGNDVIDEIKIWHADGFGDKPPEVCDESTECNWYENPNQPGGAYKLANLMTTEEAGQSMNRQMADCYFGFGAGLESNGSECTDEGYREDSGWPTGDRRVLEKHPDHSGTCIDPDDGHDMCASTDYVGIWMKVTHHYWTGFFGNAVTFETQAISKIESQNYDRPLS